MKRRKWILAVVAVFVLLTILIILIPPDFVPVRTAGNAFSTSVSESERRGVYIATYRPTIPILDYGEYSLEFDTCWVEKSWEFVDYRSSSTLPSERTYNFIIKLKNSLKGDYPGGKRLNLISAKPGDSDIWFPHGSDGFKPRGLLWSSPDDTLTYIVVYDSTGINRKELSRIQFVRRARITTH